jgi:hypothetical protein
VVVKRDQAQRSLQETTPSVCPYRHNCCRIARKRRRCVSLREGREGERELKCVYIPQIVTADLVELRDVSVHDVQMGRSSIKVVMMLVCLHTWTRHVYLSI